MTMMATTTMVQQMSKSLCYWQQNLGWRHGFSRRGRGDKLAT